MPKINFNEPPKLKSLALEYGDFDFESYEIPADKVKEIYVRGLQKDLNYKLDKDNKDHAVNEIYYAKYVKFVLDPKYLHTIRDDYDHGREIDNLLYNIMTNHNLETITINYTNRPSKTIELYTDPNDDFLYTPFIIEPKLNIVDLNKQDVYLEFTNGKHYFYHPFKDLPESQTNLAREYYEFDNKKLYETFLHGGNINQFNQAINELWPKLDWSNIIQWLITSKTITDNIPKSNSNKPVKPYKVKTWELYDNILINNPHPKIYPVLNKYRHINTLNDWIDSITKYYPYLEPFYDILSKVIDSLEDLYIKYNIDADIKPSSTQQELSIYINGQNK